MEWDFVPAGGELARAIREKHWASTPLGAVETWPEALRTAVGICLGSTFPTLVCWGPELFQIYNDPAISVLRCKHPDALGRSAREVWSEIWPEMGPVIERLMLTGKSTGREDVPLFPTRGGAPEQAFLSFSLSAIRGRQPQPLGVFVTVMETTAKLRAERDRALAAERLRASEARHEFLLELGARLRLLTDAVEIQAQASRLLGEQLGVCRVMYSNIDLDAGLAVVRQAWARSGLARLEGQLPLAGFDPALIGELAQGKTARIDDVHTDHRTRSSAASLLTAGLQAAVAVPLIKRGAFVNALAVSSTTPRIWSDADVALIEETAERTWEAVERARAEAWQRDSEARHAFLVRLGDRLREMTDAAEMTSAAAELLGHHLNVNRVVYGELDADDEHITVWSDWTDGSVPSARGRYRLADFDPDLIADYRRGQVRRTEDTEILARRRSSGDQALGIRAALGVPMLRAGRLVAGMSVHSTRPRRWTESEVQLAREVGERIWSSSERARSEAALRAREEKYRTLIESMDEGFCVLEALADESGALIDVRHLEANPAYTKHTGLSDVVGKRASELVPGGSPRWLEGYAKVLESGTPLHFEDYSAALDRWFELRVVRVACPADRQVAVLFSDVTSRRRAEEELRRAAERDAFRIALSDALGPILDPLEIQTAATRILGQYLGASRVHYAEISGDQALVRGDYTMSGVTSIAGPHVLCQYRGFFLSEVLAGRTCVCDDIASDERLGADERAALLREFGVRARASVPLVKAGVLRGLLSVQLVEPHAFSLDEIEVIEETAERTWAALERAHAEAALRQSEERFRAIVHGAHDYAIFLTDARGVITEWPEGAERVKGYAPAEAIGQPISIFYTPEDVAAGEPERELAEAAREGRAERETWRVRKGGRRFWVNEIATPVRDAAGNLVGFTRIARDLTEKKRAEEALRQLADADAYRVKLADALRALGDPVEIQAVSARVLGQHLGVARVLYSEVHGETSVVHRDYTDDAPSLRGVHPLTPFDVFLRQGQAGVTSVVEDAKHDARLPLAERSALEAYGIAALVSVPLVKGGELRATLDVHHGTPRAWSPAEVARIEDTAERTWLAVQQARAEALLRQSEERFRRALDIETVGVIFFDLEGSITRANDAFRRMTGYTQADIAEHQLSFERLTSPESAQLRARALEELESTGSTAAYEQQCSRKDGSVFWGLFAARRLSAKEGVEFILDITKRKRAEEALASTHAGLEANVARRTLELALTNRVLKNEVAQRRHAERIRSDLLRRLDNAQEEERRRVARDLHDQVGQTLTALTLAVRAMRDAGVLPPAVAARLTDVQQVAEELGREVHELAVRLRPTALDDLGLHAALGQLLSDWSARTRIEVDCQLGDLETARLPPDFETVLYRVVQEALTNVARHARAARTSVVVQRVNGSVVAVVEDDGVGFEPQTSTDRLGLLGLSERVALAGGTLSIESKTGQGTTLIARLPCGGAQNGGAPERAKVSRSST